MDIDTLSNTIIGAGIVVHKALGPGLLESAYEACVIYELNSRGIHVERQKVLPIRYKGIELDCAYRLDAVIDNQIILDFKSVAKLESIHDAQMLTYLRLTGLTLGLIMNFNVPLLKDGIRRIVNGYKKPALRS